MAVKTNCTINGVGYYRIRKKVGLKLNKDGEWIDDIKPFYGKNKTDAENMVKEYLANQKSGIKNEKEYFGKLMYYWIYEVFIKGTHSEGTKIKYECAYRLYIKNSSLSNYLMYEISSKPVQEYFNKLKLTDSQIAAIKKVLTLFLDYAESEGYCRNPIKHIAIIKSSKAQGEIVVFNKRDIRKIFNSPKEGVNSTYRFLFLLALGTGLRQGEILGLKYSDIKDSKIEVRRQISVGVDKVRKEYKTKTANGVRYVPIPNSLLKELEEHKKNKINDYVFCTGSGKLIDKSNLILSWNRFLKSINVPYKEFHTLRRTYCTMLCESGVSLQTASRLMGHSSIAVTAKYYAFVSDKSKEMAAEKINVALLEKFPKVKKGLKYKIEKKKARLN